MTLSHFIFPPFFTGTIYHYFFFSIYIKILFLFFFFNFTILYWFCHISIWIHHRYTRVPHPEPSSFLPPCTIPLGHPSAPAPNFQYPVANPVHRTWIGNSFHIWYYTCFNTILPNHPTLFLSHRVQKTVLYSNILKPSPVFPITIYTAFNTLFA